MTIEETERNALESAKKIPMTRLADLGLLDRTRPCVFGATTPLAKDLTTHLGKGVTPKAARVSAVMEALERASGEVPNGPTCRASFNELSRSDVSVVDPRLCALPDDNQFDPATQIGWVLGYHLTEHTQVWLPTDLVASPPSDGLILQPDTNGLASGNTLAEAVLHALCEIIERDTIGRYAFARLYADATEQPVAKSVETVNLPETCQKIYDDSVESGQTFKIFDHSDMGLAVVSAYLTDPNYPGPDGPRPYTFFGFGCAPSSRTALSRALTEAQQSRVSVLQGARDSFNSIPGAAEPKSDIHIGFSAIPTAPDTLNILDDLAHVLTLLKNAGFPDVFVCDLTQPKFEIPVVRVLVPGLSVFLVDRSRASWRDLVCLI